MAPKSSDATALASYFSTLDPFSEPNPQQAQKLLALLKNNSGDKASHASVVIAHLWSSQAQVALTQQGRPSAAVRNIFLRTGERLAGVLDNDMTPTALQTGHALLRADLLSVYARYLASVGQQGTAEVAGGSAGGGSGSGGLSPEPLLQRRPDVAEDAAAVVVITQLLDALAGRARNEPALQHPQRKQKQEPVAAETSKAAGSARAHAPPPPTPPPPSLGSELRSGLRHSGLLEHTAAALLRLAAAAPSSGHDGEAAAPQQTWVHVTEATKFLCSAVGGLQHKDAILSLATWHALAPPGSHTPAAAARGAAADVDAAERAAQAVAAVSEQAAEVRPLLSGPCLQFFLCWALGCTRLTVEHVAGLGGEPQEVVAVVSGTHAETASGRRLLMRPLLPGLHTTPEDQLKAACLVLISSAMVMQTTVGGGGGGRSSRCVGAASKSPSSAPYPPARIFDAVRSVLPSFCSPQLRGVDFDCDTERTDASLLLARLIRELPSRAAAARLPGLWRLLLLQLDSGLVDAMLGPLCETARLLLPNEVDAAAAAARGAALLQPPPGLSCSLRCALDAGLLPTLERAVRDPDAWSGPPDECGSDGESRSDDVSARANDCCSSDSGSDSDLSSCERKVDDRLRLMQVLVGVLGGTGAWPALLAHGPLHELVSLIASLGAVMRNLTPLTDVRSAQMNLYLLGVGLTALLQQAVDVLEWDAGRGRGEAVAQQPGLGPAQQPQQLSKGQRKKLKQKASRSGGAGEGASAGGSGGIGGSPSDNAGIYLWFDFCSTKPYAGPVTLPVIAACGGAPPAGSAAAAQQALLVSFALQQWLPPLVALAGFRWETVCQAAQGGEEAESEEEGAAAGRGGAGEAAHATAHGDDGLDETEPKCLRMCAAVLRLLARVAIRAAVLAQGTGGAGAGSGGSATGGSATAAGGAAGSAEGAAAGPDSIAAAPATRDRDPGRELASWLEGVLDPCVPALTQITNAMPAPALAKAKAGRAVVSALLDVVQAYSAAKPAFAKELLNGFQYVVDVDVDESAKGPQDASGRELKLRGSDSEMVPFSTILAEAAISQGRRPLSAFIERVAAESGQLVCLTMLEVQLRGLTKQLTSEFGGVHDRVEAAVATEAAALWRALWSEGGEGGSDWRRRCERACSEWLLAPAEGRLRLREVGVVMGSGGRNNGSDVASASSSASGAWTLCGNPSCTSLHGPSALIQPGAGVCCPHCRQATYCCAECRQQHWAAGHDRACKGGKAAARKDTPAGRQ
ncbi:hypothetical protein CHLRE_16g658150v5 [Chlamydomonas reinhardtii]|uniref:phytol kinase n=1 Tax=Chlamydomonas reinhardtii TaxID=3055 RepID=A0A2K3CTB5_CHLRE|nr:uncharacterized protein CHLRE_16g658150v5 [Chlamydomonas reinhardtii]PNW71530.1 hypothetical protein CHLRE_16g658150v5 [Chlamydomonas reinhardtii]